TVTVSLCSAAGWWCLPGLALTLMRKIAGTVIRSEALRTAAARRVTTRLPLRRRELLLSLRPEELRTVMPRERSRLRRAKRICPEGAMTIDRSGGALAPAPTFSERNGCPRLILSPPVIVGRPATVHAIVPRAETPEASVTVIVEVLLRARFGVPLTSPVEEAIESPDGRPLARHASACPALSEARSWRCTASPTRAVC